MVREIVRLQRSVWKKSKVSVLDSLFVVINMQEELFFYWIFENDYLSLIATTFNIQVTLFRKDG